jgi:hypothetical protein
MRKKPLKKNKKNAERQEKLIAALEALENKYHDKNGYRVQQILDALEPEYRTSETYLRLQLRLLMDIKITDKVGRVWKTAGKEDIVYKPNQKKDGYYRLSKYREK